MRKPPQIPGRPRWSPCPARAMSAADVFALLEGELGIVREAEEVKRNQKVRGPRARRSFCTAVCNVPARSRGATRHHGGKRGPIAGCGPLA